MTRELVPGEHNQDLDERSWDKVLFIAVNVMNKTRPFAGILERMMGLEPTTFCMANRSGRVGLAQDSYR
jgi:hypothetical protein